ncbi:MAG: peptidyl-prolyl cis-trans isomerase [Deltaproteobacteria bacterium]|nr:peptidyl-prolyl cis-trans isomerase [Deltaproteobacteria bacterium]
MYLAHPRAVRLAPLLAFLPALLCCRPGAEARPAGAPPAAPALVTVNGQRLTRHDLQHWLRRNKVNGEAALSAEDTRNALAPVVRQEILAQQALALGLDQDAGYQERLRQREAELAAFRREELARLWTQRPGGTDAAASEGEVREYFQRNATRLQSRYHVRQLLKKSAAELEPLLARLRGGTPFDEVAAGEFGQIPAAADRPWDLGYLRWEQLPEPWRDTVEHLAAGAVSDVITGTGARFWVIQLVDKKADPTITFETERSALTALLSARKAQAARAEREKQLLESAKVVYSPELSAAVPGP